MFSKLWILVRFSSALACAEHPVISPQGLNLGSIKRNATPLQDGLERLGSGGHNHCLESRWRSPTTGLAPTTDRNEPGERAIKKPSLIAV